MLTRNLRIILPHSDGSEDQDESVASQAEQAVDLSLAVPANVESAGTDYLVAYTLDYSQLKLVYIASDLPLVIETNSNTGAGGQVINLEANKPLLWYDGCGLPNPFTADVTALYLTNVNASTAANVEIRTLVDPHV